VSWVEISKPSTAAAVAACASSFSSLVLVEKEEEEGREACVATCSERKTSPACIEGREQT